MTRTGAGWFAGALALGIAAAGISRAAPEKGPVFTILKGDEPIGADTYEITNSGDTTMVHVETHTDVRVLVISYHFKHSRTETWRGGELQSFVSDTNDDGDIHHVEIRREGAGFVATSDGKKQELPPTAIPFTLWNHDVIAKPLLFDVTTMELLKVGIENRGTETLTVGGHPVSVQHFKMTGDEHWDLWYGPDPAPLKTAFTRMGYPIIFLRQ